MITQEQRLEMVEAQGKYLRISPSKVRRVANVIRGRTPQEALQMLRALPQAGAEYLYKVIKSAAANAVHNNKWDESELVIGELLVNEGPRSKRFQPKARGRIYQITKRSSHIIVRIARKSKKGGA